MSARRNCVPLVIKAGSAEISDEMCQADEARARRNRSAWDAGIRPTGPEAVKVGDLVMPLEEQWQRGRGLVDKIDREGNVWATYGQRENPHPDDSKTVRCRSPWSEIVIVDRATATAKAGT